MIAGGLGSPKKKYLCLYFRISYLIVHSYLHQTIDQQGIDAQRSLHQHPPHSDIQTPHNRYRNLTMAIIGRNMQFHIFILEYNTFSNQLCCLTTFSSLSLVTHRTGMTHLKEQNQCRFYYTSSVFQHLYRKTLSFNYDKYQTAKPVQRRYVS